MEMYFEKNIKKVFYKTSISALMAAAALTGAVLTSIWRKD
jgi:hypothetical protein